VILTLPYEEDLRALQDDVRKAKRLADAVVISLHWGIHFVPKAIADYQPIVALPEVRPRSKAASATVRVGVPCPLSPLVAA